MRKSSVKLNKFKFAVTVGVAVSCWDPTVVSANAFVTPLVIAHRGASGLRPEHTKAAYELAIEADADFIEADLVITKDNVLIVRHENEISSTTNIAQVYPKRRSTKTVDGKKIEGWFAEDFTLKEIKKLYARERLPGRDRTHDDQYRVLTFDEFLRFAVQKSKENKRTIGVYIETKHPTYFRSIGKPLEARVAKAIKKFRLGDETAPAFLQSFELESLRELKKQVQTRRVYLLDEGSMVPADFVKSGDKRTYAQMTSPAALREIRKIADGIGPYKRLILPETADGQIQKPTRLIDDAHDAGLFVHPFTFRSDKEFLAFKYKGDAIEEYRDFYALGVDGVFSDFPADAIRARKEKQK